ncbi:hypothetical protein MASR2M79_05200 [Aminivibrio sp.]
MEFAEPLLPRQADDGLAARGRDEKEVFPYGPESAGAEAGGSMVPISSASCCPAMRTEGSPLGADHDLRGVGNDRAGSKEAGRPR